MGCDIHIYTECLKTIRNEEQWVNCDSWKWNPYYDGSEEENEYNIEEIYDDRNYSLFAMLADVRNYAGAIPIATPRGVPIDMSKPTRVEYERWDGDGHSHSWLTLAEIKKYANENNVTVYSGLVSPGDAKRIDEGDMPFSYCQGTNQKDYVYRKWVHEHHHFDKLIEALESIKKNTYFKYSDKDHPEYDDKIRIVFWFDN